MRIAVILPAAGSGRRFGEADKLEMDIAGVPVFLRALEPFLGRPDVAQVLLAVAPDGLEGFCARHGQRLAPRGVQIVPGGRAERWQTVQQALERVRSDCTHVAVHDAARPLVSPALIDRVFAAAVDHAAVIPATPVAATLKRIHEDRVVRTVDRRGLFEAQTPQVFEVALFRRAYAMLSSANLAADGITDDASLVEALGEPVAVVPGEPTNLKITLAADATLAAAVLACMDRDITSGRHRSASIPRR